ncbi:DUF5107 domain-containing protein [Agromyces sp. Soil535]|uniref:DUF5107 domain-containing protein n=1 Tax=Agromyces sp. Soil535 TaxID=1736390 RepID=UPI0006FDF97B|nr:DUF5107 domain-containing protein [Agromyces sp. Soil535]KRE31505.1 hypothetical protein ASG80_00725 [Agromyces sp. Soil535]
MIDDAALLRLPDTPADQAGLPVAAWSEPVRLRTYEAGDPGAMPAFLEHRVYQGSSGRVYPLPFIESVAHEPTVREWKAVHLENEYVRLMIMPELGGRIHVAYDKPSGRDFFYRNNVIKPALVGLAGPWLAGGVEFNWPQHHRPATYLPVDWTIEREADDSVTVWCSDHDPFERMKGMHGIRLRPGSAVVEARVRLFNRTSLTQTFLWWANVAVHVNDDYQSFFPEDVTVVADHAKRAITAFPAADRPYYGIDYPARADAASPQFRGPDADRLDWYRNIPVPTSYMCVGSEDDFFGGYDHGIGLGFVHVADHRIAPGKKQWTWGNAPFGWAWDANLSDGDGPYVELMAGVYTDNQPDFSYLAPGETKSFSQYWFPYHGIGPVTQATTDAAASLRTEDRDGRAMVELGVVTTRAHSDVRVRLHDEADGTIWLYAGTIAPGAPVRATVEVESGTGPFVLIATDGDIELVRCSTAIREPAVTDVETATALPEPEEIASADELYLAGVHLAQYRHATRSPEPYWQELLRRDPLDSRGNTALGQLRMRDGRLEEAERHLRAAIARETRRNPNPVSGEAHYLLGLVLVAQGRRGDAYDALSKSLWNAAWRVPAGLELARLDASAEEWSAALEHARQVLRLDSEQLQAIAISAMALRRLNRPDEADDLLDRAGALDPLDLWTRDLSGDPVTSEAHALMDLAAEYRSVGADEDELRQLDAALAAATDRPVPAAGNPIPLIHYFRAEVLDRLGRTGEARVALAAARSADADGCFAGGLSEALMLERATTDTDADARAHTLLAHWLYFHRRYEDAVVHLERAAELDPGDAVVWRGLGLAAYNVRGDRAGALRCYERAIDCAPRDAKLLHEADQLARRTGRAAHERLKRLEAVAEVVASRDDLTTAYAELLVLNGDAEAAHHVMAERRFTPWEGGEGEVLRVWELVQQSRAALASAAGHPDDAVAALEAALDSPANLGEARHELANFSDVLLAYGDALASAGRHDEARAAWTRAARSAGDFTSMLTVPYSPMTYFSVLAARRLGDEHTAAELADGLRTYVSMKEAERPSIDYFATSLPTMLTFDDDLEQGHRVLIAVMRSELALLDGRATEAAGRLEALSAVDPADPLVRRLLVDATASIAA